MKPQRKMPESQPNPEIPELLEAEALCQSLRAALIRTKDVLVDEQTNEKLELVLRWVDAYRRGMLEHNQVGSSGLEVLHEARNQLELSLEERLRLEDEGGNPATPEQARQNEEIAKAVRRFDQLIPVIERSLAPTEHVIT